MSVENQSEMNSKFNGNSLRDGGEEMVIPPIYDSQPSLISGIPETLPLSPLFVDCLNELCPTCSELLYMDKWQSPIGISEATINFNETQTAFIHTAAEALARLTGNPSYRENRAMAVMDVIRLFLLSDPTAAIMAKHMRPGRVARGKTVTADWVEVVKTPSVVTEPPPNLVAGSVESSAAEALYDEMGDGDDLYEDIGDGSKLREG